MSLYKDCVSREPLAIIKANECEAEPGLATARFRRLWNELVEARVLLEKALTELDEHDAEYHHTTPPQCRALLVAKLAELTPCR